MVKQTFTNCAWMLAKSQQSCLTLWDHMDGTHPDSSVHGISQAGILEGVAISFSRGLSQPVDQTQFSCFGRQILYHWATLVHWKQFWMIKNTIWEIVNILLANIPWHLFRTHFQTYMKKCKPLLKIKSFTWKMWWHKDFSDCNFEQFKLKTNMHISNKSLSCI